MARSKTMTSLLATFRKHDGKLLLPVLDKHLLARNQEQREPDNMLHPSQLGRFEDLCARQIAFDLFSPRDFVPVDMLSNDHSPRFHRIFDNGDFTHIRYQALCVEAGVCHPKKGIGWEVPLELPGLYIRGHADGIIYPDAVNTVRLGKVPSGRGTTSVPLLTAEGFVYPKEDEKNWKPKGAAYMLEVKSIKDFYWQRLFEPDPKHRMQAMTYMAVAKQKVPDLAGTIFVYESKDTQEIKEYLLPFNPEFWASVQGRIDTAKRARKAGKLPEGVCDTYNERSQACPWNGPCFDTKIAEKIQRSFKNAPKPKTVKNPPSAG